MGPGARPGRRNNKARLKRRALGQIRCLRAYFVAAGAPASLSLASLRHSERNFLRSLPCRPLASAPFEHSSEAAECTTGFLSIFAAGAAGAGEAAGAGAVPCAKAELISNTE